MHTSTGADIRDSSLTLDASVKRSQFAPDSRLPLVVEPARPGVDLAAWAAGKGAWAVWAKLGVMPRPASATPIQIHSRITRPYFSVQLPGTSSCGRKP